MSRHTRIAAEVLLTASAGWLVMVLPVRLDPGHRDYGSLMRDVIEGFKLYSLGLIAAGGFAAGLIGRTPSLVLGLATVAALPAWAILDMALGHDHNLFPMEFAFYGFYSLFGIVGARLGRRARDARQRATP